VSERVPASRLLTSTRRRLALVTLVLIGALVLAIGAATAFVATRALDQDVDRVLEQSAVAESQRLAGELPSGGGDASDERPPEASDTFFLVLDPSGNLVSNPSGVPRQGLPDEEAVAAPMASTSAPISASVTSARRRRVEVSSRLEGA